MLVLLYITIGLLGVYLFLRNLRKQGKSLPGPKGWPLIGVGLDLTPQNMFFKLTDYNTEHGNLFKMNIFGSDIVVLSSAELIRKAFSADPYKKFMNDRALMYYSEVVLHQAESIAFYPRAFGTRHGDLRKGFTQAMNVYGEGRKQFETLVLTELERVVKEIESNKGEQFDMQDLIKRFLESVISVILCGKPLKTKEEFQAFWDFDSANDFFLNQKVDTLMRVFPFLRHLPTIYRDRYRQIMNAKAKLTNMFYEESKATYEAGVIRGIVDFMIRDQLQAKQNQQPGEDILFSDERIINTILETIAAGVLTTLSNLSSMFLILANHPECQLKIQQEIDDVIGTDRAPRIEDKPRCTLIEAVAMETHRYVPVLPGMLFHACKSDEEFEGYHVPKNSAILPNIFHVHHDETVWGDPWTFRPERFLDDNGEILPNDHPFRKSWLAFGTGRRQCAGESLARSRVFLFVSTLFQRWTFRLPPGVRLPCDPRDGGFDFNLNCRPRPFEVIAVPRMSKKED